MIYQNVISIDGPAGVGKTSAASELSKRLGFLKLETGAIYRSIAFVCLRDTIDCKNECACTNIFKNLSVQFDEINGQHMFYKNEEITPFLKSKEINQNINVFSDVRIVRENAGIFFRKLVENGKGYYVVEGRDVGTAVFPNARCKFFITADSKIRARRRALQDQGGDASKITTEILQGTMEILDAMDSKDKVRLDGPCIPADDAVFIDTSSMTFAEVMTILEKITKERIGSA